MQIYQLSDGKASLKSFMQFYDDLIPSVFPNHFPKNYALEPTDWYLTESVVHRPLQEKHGVSLRPLSTLDVEFLSNDLIDQARRGEVDLGRNYPCGLKCPGCFSEDATYLDASKFLRWQDVFKIIDDARHIGLKTLKFLGPGELFQNPDLFNILDAMEERGLAFSIFTKGAELGDDHLANLNYGSIGIRTSKDLVSRISEYSCLRILLGFNSFDPILQDRMVGSLRTQGHYLFKAGTFQNRGVERYTEKRNNALANLVGAGFNSTPSQRLSLIAAPVGLDQTDEIAEMYVWAARRNIPLVIAPTMESGPKSVGLMKHNKKNDPQHEKLKRMYLTIYRRALDEGIILLDRLKQQGVSAYIGTAPCNQVANGLFLRINGAVQMCPGAHTAESVYGDVHASGISEIWQRSFNYSLGALGNNWCTAKTNGMPQEMQEEILEQLVREYGSHNLTYKDTADLNFV